MIEKLGVWVDTSTGEIVQPSIPLEFLPVEQVVGNVLSEVYGFSRASYTGSEINPPVETRGRKPKVVFNPYREYFSGLAWNESNSSYDMLPLMNDILMGACRNNTNSNVIPHRQVILLLCVMDELTAESVKEAMNRKRAFQMGQSIGDRYARMLVAAAEALINSMQYHMAIGDLVLEETKSFQFSEDSKEYQKYYCVPSIMICTRGFTSGERHDIRQMVQRGHIEYIYPYLQEIEQTSKKWLQRAITCTPVRHVSDFQYDPYLSGVA